MYSFGLFGSYPIQMVPCIDIIENTESYKKLPNLSFFDIRYYTVRTLYVLFTGFVAIYVPRFGRFVDFNGALSGTTICVVFPIVIHETVFKDRLSIKQKVMNRVAFAIGTIFGISSLVIAFVSLVRGF